MIKHIFMLLNGFFVCTVWSSSTKVQQSEKAEPLSMTCIACHGDQGNGSAVFPDYPKLSGLSEAYLLKQLQDLKWNDAGVAKRNAPIMNPNVMMLQPEDMQVLAHYFSQQKRGPIQPVQTEDGTEPVVPETQSFDEATLAMGKDIWVGGIANKNVPRL